MTFIPTGSSSFSSTVISAANLGSFHGLGIPLVGGTRAVNGVPIFAGPVKTSGSGRTRDIAYAFGESVVPDDVLIDTQMTKLWVNETLVQQRDINTGWNTSGGISFAIYPGYCDQKVDPRIVDVVGATNAPAFRDLVYIVFYDFPLHIYSPANNIPVVRAELVDIIANSARVGDFSLTLGTELSTQSITPNWERNHVYMFLANNPGGDNDDFDCIVVDLTTNTEIARNRVTFVDGTFPTALGLSSVDGAFYLEPRTSYLITSSGVTNSRIYHTLDPYSGVILDSFGTNGSSTVDTATQVPASGRRAFVSTSQNMSDLLIATAGLTSEEIGFLRVAADGTLTRAFTDVDAILGDLATDGEVVTMMTGDRIGAVTASFSGFGTIFVCRDTIIDRIVVPEGLNGDGSGVTVDTSTDIMHRETTVDEFTGLSFPGEYVDVVDFEDTSNGATTPAAFDGIMGPVTIDLGVDLVDASAKTLSDRTVAWIDYGSGRDITGFTFQGFGLDGDVGGYDFVLVESSDGVTFTEITLPTTVGQLGFQDRDNAVSLVTNNSTGGVQIKIPATTVLRNVGIAMVQADYTLATDLELTALAFHGSDGFEVSVDDAVIVPPLTVPLLHNIWIAPTGHSILMGWTEPESEDIIVLFELDADTTQQYLTRLRLNDDIRGVANPTDPAGLGVSEEWVTQITNPITTISLFRHSLDFSNLTANSLGFANSDATNTFTLITLSTGHERVLDFDNWRFFGAGSDEVGNIAIENRQVWNGPGGYFIGSEDQAASPAAFGFTKLFPYKTGDEVALSDLLDWISQRSGFDSSEISVSGITDTIIGFILTERTGFRDLMENLGKVFDFGTFESEGQIKFVSKAKGGSFSIDETLVADDLSPIEEGEGFDPNDPAVEVSRDPADDQPGIIELRFIDQAAGYINNLSTAQRTQFPVSTTNADTLQTSQFGVPIVMTTADAHLLVSRMLYRLWIAQAKVKFRLPTEFLDAEPTDIFSIPVDGVTYTVQGETTIINADHSISVEAEAIGAEEIAAIDSDESITMEPAVSGPGTIAYFLDIPPLIDGDVTSFEGKGITIFSAASSKGQGAWTGGQFLYKEVNPFLVLNTTQPDEDNSAAGLALGFINSAPESQIDHSSELTISMTAWDGTMVTATEEELQDGVTNLAAYGQPGRWEIIQVGTVTQVVNEVFKMTNIIRSLRGTELNSAQHLPNDLFILLQRPPLAITAVSPLSSLDEEVTFKGVGLTQDEVRIIDKFATLKGVFERMFPPRDIAATTSGSDVIFSWSRRTRLQDEIVDSEDFTPLENTALGFEVEIYGSEDSNTPVRTITDITGESTTYLNATALTDFGGVPETFHLRVYQISSEVGRGVPEIVTIEVDA